VLTRLTALVAALLVLAVLAFLLVPPFHDASRESDHGRSHERPEGGPS